LAEATEGFGAVRSLIDEFGLVQAVLLGGFEFVFQVTHQAPHFERRYPRRVRSNKSPAVASSRHAGDTCMADGSPKKLAETIKREIFLFIRALHDQGFKAAKYLRRMKTNFVPFHF
jgi:hypothetical protein